MMIVVKSSPVVFVLDIQYVSCFRAQTSRFFSEVVFVQRVCSFVVSGSTSSHTSMRSRRRRDLLSQFNQQLRSFHVMTCTMWVPG